jgi:glycosyltransferase involved in cell wall biosynthesis
VVVEKGKTLRVAWLANSPGPNQTDFFDSLSKEVGIDLRVLYCAKRNSKWRGTDSNCDGHNANFMWNLNPRPEKNVHLHFNPEAIFEVIEGNFDMFVVSGGYSFPTSIMTMIALALIKRRWLFWGEMINRNPSFKTTIVKKPLVYPLLRRAEAILTMGEKGEESYKTIGIGKKNIFQMPYSCNLDEYLKVNRDIGKKRNHRRLSIIVTARLIELKRVGLAIEGFVSLADKYKEWDLKICGDGPLRKKLEEKIPREYRNRVQFLGFVTKENQPDMYSESDIFLLTSRQDGWGMVIPEAMATGLPVICTSAVESAKEMLVNRDCGILIEPENKQLLTDALESLMKEDEIRKKMSLNARKKAVEYSSEKIAHRCANILREVQSRR